MNPNITDEKESKGRSRFEDSFSLPENQRHCPDDPYVMEHEKEVMEKWHRKMEREDMRRMVA
jgi:hypothetical protein